MVSNTGASNNPGPETDIALLPLDDSIPEITVPPQNDDVPLAGMGNSSPRLESTGETRESTLALGSSQPESVSAVNPKPSSQFTLLSDPTLPDGWNVYLSFDNRRLYVNHALKKTTWNPPLSATSSFSSLSTASTALDNTELLPWGWEQRVQPSGRILYINHNLKKNTWIDPRTKHPSSESPTSHQPLPQSPTPSQISSQSSSSFGTLTSISSVTHSSGHSVLPSDPENPNERNVITDPDFQRIPGVFYTEKELWDHIDKKYYSLKQQVTILCLCIMIFIGVVISLNTSAGLWMAPAFMMSFNSFVLVVYIKGDWPQKNRQEATRFSGIVTGGSLAALAVELHPIYWLETGIFCFLFLVAMGYYWNQIRVAHQEIDTFMGENLPKIPLSYISHKSIKTATFRFLFFPWSTPYYSHGLPSSLDQFMFSGFRSANFLEFYLFGALRNFYRDPEYNADNLAYFLIFPVIFVIVLIFAFVLFFWDIFSFLMHLITCFQCITNIEPIQPFSYRDITIWNGSDEPVPIDPPSDCSGNPLPTSLVISIGPRHKWFTKHPITNVMPPPRYAFTLGSPQSTLKRKYKFQHHIPDVQDVEPVEIFNPFHYNPPTTAAPIAFALGVSGATGSSMALACALCCALGHKKYVKHEKLTSAEEKKFKLLSCVVCFSLLLTVLVIALVSAS